MSDLLDDMSVPGVAVQNDPGLTTTNILDTLDSTSSPDDINQNDGELPVDAEKASRPAPARKRKLRRPPPKLFIDRDRREASGKGSVGIGYFVTKAALERAVEEQLARKRAAEAAKYDQPPVEPPAKKKNQRKPKDAMARERNHYNHVTATGHLDYEDIEAGSHVTSEIVTPEVLSKMPKPVSLSKDFDESPAQKAEVVRKMDFLSTMFPTLAAPAQPQQTAAQQTVDLTSSDMVNSQVSAPGSSKHEATDSASKPIAKKVLADKTNIHRPVVPQRGQGSIKPTAMDMLVSAAKKQPMSVQKVSSSAKAATSKKRGRAEDENEVVETTKRSAKKLRADPTPVPTVSAAQASAAPTPTVANTDQAATETEQVATKDIPKQSQGKRPRDATEDDDADEDLPIKKNKTDATDWTQLDATLNETFGMNAGGKPQKKRSRKAAEVEDETEVTPTKKTKTKAADLTEVEASPNEAAAGPMNEEASSETAEVQEAEGDETELKYAPKKRSRDDIEAEEEIEALPKKKAKVRTADLTEMEASPNEATAGEDIGHTATEAAEFQEAEPKEADINNANAQEAESRDANVEEANTEQPEGDAAEEEDDETASTTNTKIATSNASDAHVAPKDDADTQQPRKKGVAYSTKSSKSSRSEPKTSAKKDDVRKYFMGR